MAVTITVHQELTRMKLPNGKDNPFVDLVIDAIDGGANRGFAASDLHCKIYEIARNEYQHDGEAKVRLDRATVAAILATGQAFGLEARVEEWYCWVQLAAGVETQDIPAYVPESTISEGEPGSQVTRQRTWLEHAHYTPRPILDGNGDPTGEHVVACQTRTGAYTAAVSLQLDDEPGITLLAPPAKPDFGGPDPII